jgi:hypothetical protein
VNKRWIVFVLVAVLVLVALYVASLGLNLRRGQRDARAPEPTPAPEDGDEGALNAPWVRKLKDRMTTRLKGEDLSLEEGPPGCRLRDERLEVPLDAECEYTIAPGDRTRALRPSLVQGSAITLILTQEGYLEVEQGLPSEDEERPSMDVYRNEESAQLVVTGCEVDEAALCLVSLKP